MEEMTTTDLNIKGSRQDNSRIVCTRLYETPCGTLVIGTLGDKLCLCDWLTSLHRLSVDRRLVQTLRTVYRPLNTPVNEETTHQLDEYFSGKRRQFSIPLLLLGTEFQKNVWRRLLEIPYGKTASYGEVAASVGKPRAIRAVAKACAANALAIFVPCHRVIGADGVATGYAGGSNAKKHLLDLERRVATGL